MNENLTGTNASDFNPNTMKACRVCGEAIAKEAKVCPHCGAKNKKPIFKRVSTYVIIAIILIAGYFILSAMSSVNMYELSDDAYIMSKEEYKDNCQEMSYDDLARNAENMVGEKVKFTGEVFQVIFEGESFDSEYFIAVTKDEELDLYDDNVHVYYDSSSGGRILDEDIVTFYGEVTGLYTYESTAGMTFTIPEVNAVYIDIED